MSLGCLAAAQAGGPVVPPHRMLHECFRIKEPSGFDKSLLQALDIVIGEWRLGICAEGTQPTGLCHMPIENFTARPPCPSNHLLRRGEAGHGGGGQHAGGRGSHGLACAARANPARAHPAHLASEQPAERQKVRAAADGHPQLACRSCDI